MIVRFSVTELQRMMELMQMHETLNIKAVQSVL
ncbi:hypothetical protein Ah1_00180 [Aeromonas phage Ah1]|uniref:Uncharacterized protein n=1 Tax=Aeromonas phage Ah1 TaxID=2053701 RepID=A0A2H4YFI3_9CAUD|nr:hypothetical protein KNT77_gp330 [Aeromonas phage Ah1]AUE22706.1 hypothetical protein Ah1_00180 [Aeromonas phage Ah1]